MELKELPQRERRILYLRSVGKSRREIAEELDLMVPRVKQIEMQALAKLAEKGSTFPRLGRNVMTPLDMWHQIEQERLRGDFYRALGPQCS